MQLPPLAPSARTRSVARSLACLIALSCAHETSERPRARTPAPRATTSALPFPETAFQGDHADAGASAPDRFTTRRIEDDGRETHAPYTGARIDLDLEGADLGDVFRLLAEVGHVNIVVGGDVKGTITLRMKSVPWDQALDAIARTRGLAVARDGNVIMVTVGYPDRPR